MALATELSAPTTAPAFAWLRRVGWLERIGLAGVLVITLVAIFGPLFVPYDPMLRVAAAYLPPDATH